MQSAWTRGFVDLSVRAPQAYLVEPPAAPVWHIRIRERDGSNSVLGYLGEQVPTPSVDNPAYENVAMPKSAPVSVFRQYGNLTFAFEIIFSKFTTDESVASDIEALWDMYYGGRFYDVAPPVVKFNAAGNLLPFENLDWWISGLEWGDAEANAAGQRTLQRFAVTLTQYLPDVRLTPNSSGKLQAKWPAMVVVKKGWTLKTIADKYKVPGGWRAIGHVQTPPISDPRKVRTGQHIRMP